jgi:predicted dienelactone hydrolase
MTYASSRLTRRSLAGHGLTLFGLAALQPEALAQTFSLEPSFSVSDQVWHDPSRNRDIPLRLRIPAPRVANERLPVILYSPGLGGTRDAAEHWSDHWASNGYVVTNVQHRGSDQLYGAPGSDPIEVVRRLAAATTPTQLAQRVGDLHFVLDDLSNHGQLAAAAQNRIGIAGHAFGALTVQAMAGQNVSRHGPDLADPRVTAVIAFSPVVRNRVDAETQFGDVNQPFLSITGTLDNESAGYRVAAEERVRPFYSMPPGGKYLLVFRNGDHQAFSGSVGNLNATRSAEAANAEPRIIRASQAVSLAFWDAYLKRNLSAEAWLSSQARGILSAEDRFERR